MYISRNVHSTKWREIKDITHILKLRMHSSRTTLGKIIKLNSSVTFIINPDEILETKEEIKSIEMRVSVNIDFMK